MKKFLSVLLMVMLLLSSLAICAGAAEGRTYHGEIPILADHKNEVRLDGVRENLYANAVEIPINRWRMSTTAKGYAEEHLGISLGGTKIDSGDPNDPTSMYCDGQQREIGELSGTVVTQAGVATGLAWVIYDGEYLWIFAEITDDDVNSPLGGVHNAGNYWKSDALEIRINWKNNKKQEDVYNASLNYEGFLVGGKTGLTQGLGAIDDGYKTPCTWFEAYAVVTDVGYNIEARIDMTEFADELETEYIGIAFNIQDCKANCDQTTRMIISSEENGGGDKYAGTYGYMKFDYASQPVTGDMTVIYVIIAMVSAFAVGGVSVFLLKKKASVK